jgi:hypothetical protein
MSSQSRLQMSYSDMDRLFIVSRAMGIGSGRELHQSNSVSLSPQFAQTQWISNSYQGLGRVKRPQRQQASGLMTEFALASGTGAGSATGAAMVATKVTTKAMVRRMIYGYLVILSSINRGED